MKIRTILATAALVLLPFAAAAQQPPAIGIELVGPGKYAGAFEETATTTVEAIDKATRSVFLQRANGEQLVVVCGPEVKNFDQIKVGDKVVSRHIVTLEMMLKKGGDGIATRAESTNKDSAKPGEKPAAYEAKKVAFVANVQRVNTKKQTVTLKGTKYTFDLNIKDPAQLKLIKKGDQVEGVFIEALAVEVVPAPAKAKK